MKKLNIGCGINIKEGYDNLDIVKFENVDIVWDLNKFPYPIEDNTYDEIYARHVIEHLNDLVGVIKEFYRILAPNGKLIIEVPHQTSYHAFSFQHTKYFQYYSLEAFAENTKKNLINKEYGLHFAFKYLKRKLIFPRGLHIESCIIEPLMNLIPKIYEGTFLRYLFPAFAVRYEFEK